MSGCKSKKKELCRVAILVLVGLFFSVSGALSQTSVGIDPDTSSVAVGDTFAIDVVIGSTPSDSIQGFNIILDYDEGILEVLEVTEGALFSGSGFTTFWQVLSDSPSVHVNDATLGLSDIVGPGVLFSVKFTAIAQGQSDLILQHVDIRNPHNDSLSVVPTDGIVYVAGGEAPEITLNYPENGAMTTNNYMELSVTVSDPDGDSMTAWIYGDTTANASDLLYVEEGVDSGSTIIYNWTAPVMEVETGTQGLWHLNESSGDSVHDETTNDNDGIIIGATWTTDGRFGYALQFDGVGDTVLIPYSLSLNITDSLTLQAWVKLSGTPNYFSNGVLTKVGPGTPEDNTANYCYGLWVLESQQATCGVKVGGQWYYITSLNPLSLNTWYYLAGTFDGNTLVLYVNGGLAVDSAVTGNIESHTLAPVGIGCAHNRPDRVFLGTIDEARISNRALTPEEIAANYRLGSTYYWKVRASDGVNEDTSETRYFHVVLPSDSLPPEVTLNYPSNDSTTPNGYMELSATVSDESPMTVWIYGDTTANASDLLYVEEGVDSGSTIIYNWTAPVMEVETGTQGLWHFDESSGDSTYDETTNDNDGALMGPSWTTSGRFGYALSFDGTNDYVVVSDASQTGLDMGTGDFTIEAWIRTSDPLDDWRPIVTKDQAGAPRYYMGITHQEPAGALRGYISDNTNTYYATGTTLVNDGNWHYVAAVYDRDVGIRLFIDAVEDSVTEVGTITSVGNLDNVTDFSIGRDERLNDYFAGLIDEVRVTNRALTAEEIVANYQLGSTYHWKVRASDGVNEDTSETRYFHVVPAGVAIPTLISPADSSVISDTTPEFIWSSTAGVGGSYTLEYGPNLSDPDTTITGIAETTYTVPDAYTLSETTYYWHVQAFDSEGDSSGYQVHPFMFTIVTDITPPEITLNYPPNDFTTTNPYMELSVTVTDQSPMTVWIYGDTSDASDLLYVEEDVIGTDIIYNWTAPVMEVETGTQGLWHFDESSGDSTYDETANDNDGAIMGPSWTTSGRFGYALSFDGTDDYVVVSDAAQTGLDMGTNDFTIQAWIKTTDTTAAPIVAKDASGVPRYYFLITEYQSAIGAGHVRAYISDNVNTYYSTSITTVNDGEWHYLVGVYDRDSMIHIFIDGVEDSVEEVGTIANVGDLDNPTDFTIGYDQRVRDGSYFNGTIDEVRVTDRALTPEEIVANYQLGSTYYWKVRASDGLQEDTSETRYFNVIAAGSLPTLIAPADSAVIDDNTPTFVWSSTAGDGGSYTLQYALDGLFSQGLVTVSGISNPSYTVPDGQALSDTSYYWHVQAFNAQGDSSGYQAHPFMFTVDSDIPDVPTLLTPVDSSYTNDNTPTFTWSEVTKLGGEGPSVKGKISKVDGKGDKATPVTYTLQCATDEGFSDIVIDTAGLTGTSYTVPGGDALADTTYYWRVEAVDQAENHSGYQADPFMFTVDTGTPQVPVLLTPADSFYTNDNTPTFTWSQVTKGSGPSLVKAKISKVGGKGGDKATAVSYTLQCATDEGFSNLVIDTSGLTGTSYTVPGTYALADTTYYWHVEAVDEAENHSGYTDPFILMVDTEPPSKVLNLEASSVDTTVTLTWSPATDNWVGVHYYVIYRDTASFTPTPEDSIWATKDTAYIDTAVVFGGTYYYRVSAVDYAENEGEYSDEAQVVEVGVKDRDVLGLPKEYSLSQNYPNPFNPLTVIEYQIPKDDYVVLRIYNVAGQVIRTLVDEDKRAGFYTVRWDGRNEVGNEVASGIYFLRMVAGRYSSTRKMVILK